MLSIAVIYWILIYIVCDANLHMFFITKLLEYNFYVFLTNIVRDISFCKNHYLLDTIKKNVRSCLCQVQNRRNVFCKCGEAGQILDVGLGVVAVEADEGGVGEALRHLLEG